MGKGNEQMRAAAYYRMSTDEQTESIERQRSQVEPYAKQRGYKIVATYADEGIAGDEFAKRKDFQRLLRDAAKGDFDVIIADELSRISRQEIVEFIGTVVHPLQQAGVGIDTAKDGPMGWDDVVKIIMLAVRQSKSVDESKSLSRRVLTGMARTARRGQALAGRSAYGYKRDFESGKLLQMLPQSEIVREIFRRAASGESLWSVANDLNARGVPSPRGSQRGKAWCAHTLSYIIRNRAYIGEAVWGKTALGKYYKFANGQAVPRSFSKQTIPQRGRRKEKTAETDWIIVPDAHEPLIDRATFDAANRAVERRSRPGRAPHKSPNPEAYVFSGLIECGLCGYALCGLADRTRQRVRCECGWRGVAWLKPGVLSLPCARCGASRSRVRRR